LISLKGFDITILDKLGKENVVANFVSKITNEGDVIPIEYAFLGEHLFVLYINTLLFVYISNYLAAINLPQHLSPKKLQGFIKIIHGSNATSST
jgi:hypothetical protein